MRLGVVLAAAPLLVYCTPFGPLTAVLQYYLLRPALVSDSFLFGLLLTRGQFYATKKINKNLGKKIDSLVAICDTIIEKYPRQWLDRHTVGAVSGALARLKVRRPALRPQPLGYPLELGLLHGAPASSNSTRCILEALAATLSPACAAQESDQAATGYTLSHQAIYYTIASGMSPFPFLGDEVLRRRCQKMLSEVIYAWEEGVPDQLVDLFIEEVAVCGMNNFKEFLAKPILEFILSLQNEDGCFALRKTGSLSECDDHLSSVSMVAIASFIYSINESQSNYSTQYFA